MKSYFMVIERDSAGWYVGSIPELPGCHTQGRTIGELIERMQEALALYLEDMDDSLPQPSEFVGVQRVEVS